MLELKHISKKFPAFALEDVSFRVERGDYFILLGESGAGKSMVLETIAGLVKPEKGSMVMEGRDITREKIQERGIGLVFQDHAVFPHLKVSENIAYSLHGSKLDRKERARKVSSVCEQLGIGSLGGRHPSTLSGGELQRVALARTLIQEPRILLLDEPLASLDTRLKADLRALLRRIHRSGQTIVHVTHDYEEALSLGTRIAVIDRGRIVQEGTPEEVFQYPRSGFVAHFAGIRNFFPATINPGIGEAIARIGEGMEVSLPAGEPGGQGFIIIRGEDVVLSGEPFESSMVNHFKGTVIEMEPSGNGIVVTVDTGVRMHALITPGSVSRLGIAEGATVWVHFKSSAVRFIRG